MARQRLAAALMALAATTAFAQESLGTLFMSPEERAKLDALRRGEAVAPGTSAAPAGEHAVTGYVQRSDGRATVWIDGRAVKLAPRHAQALEPRIVRDYAEPESGVHIEPAQPR